MMGAGRVQPGWAGRSPAQPGPGRLNPGLPGPEVPRSRAGGQEYSGYSTLEWRDVAVFQAADQDGRFLNLRVVAGGHGWSGAPLEVDSGVRSR